MTVLPELEKIEVDTPPPSPILFVDSLDARLTQEVISPTKRERLSSGKTRPSKRRKKKKNIVPHSPQRPEEVVPQPHSNDEEVSEAPADGYTAYVTAVSQQLAGFYPLSDELYIVQGWDNKTSFVKVSSSLTHE
jgi:hypothetical protein